MHVFFKPNKQALGAEYAATAVKAFTYFVTQYGNAPYDETTGKARAAAKTALRLDPRLSEPHNPGATEHVVLSTGRALIGPAAEPADLGPGDYIWYPGDAPHIFKALEPDTTAVLIMEHI